MKLDDIEETLPNKPNFLLVVVLFGATILAIALGALVLLHMEGSHLNFLHHRSRPDARVRSPNTGPVERERDGLWA